MPLTLVTGANGFVGATIVSTLLSQGHHVILAVRAVASGEALISIHGDWPREKITVFAVPDFTIPGAFDELFKANPTIDYIVHVAAPLLDDPRNIDFVEHFEKPSVIGNIGLLNSAKSFGPNVKAISVTGSINAITLGDQDDIKARVLSNREWLGIGREEAIKAQNNYVSVSNVHRDIRVTDCGRYHTALGRSWPKRQCGISSSPRNRPLLSPTFCLL